MKTGLNNQELFNFCEQLAIILRSGISSTEGLSILRDDSVSETSRTLLSSLISGMDETGSLSEAMEGTGVFPDVLISHVKVGEETGCLDEVMQSMAGYYEQEIEVSRYIKSAVAYPLLMLGMMGAVILILLVRVLPVFQQVFRQIGLEMNGFSAGLLRAGEAVSRYSYVFFILVAVLIAGILFFCFHPKGRMLLGRAILRIPRLCNISVSLDYGRLTQGVALGLRSGLSPDASIELAKRLVQTPMVKERLEETIRLMKEGEMFSQAMTESGLFHGMEARLISIGFHAGAADEVMNKLSARYHEDSLSMVSHIVSVLEPTIVIILSLLVGLVLLSVMMPLLGMLSEMMI